MFNLSVLTVYSLIITFSVIGYGYLFVDFFFKSKKFEISIIGIFGLFF